MGGSGWLFFSHGGKASGVFFRRASLNGQHANHEQGRAPSLFRPQLLFETGPAFALRPRPRATGPEQPRHASGPDLRLTDVRFDVHSAAPRCFMSSPNLARRKQAS